MISGMIFIDHDPRGEIGSVMIYIDHDPREEIGSQV
jgi:hypothetical protein